MTTWVLTMLYLVGSICHSHAFYYKYRIGQNIEVKATQMTSNKTQQSPDYYSLPFCLPKSGHQFIHNAGKLRIADTPYEMRMAENVKCKILCNRKDNRLKWFLSELYKVIECIQNEYFMKLWIDYLPITTVARDSSSTAFGQNSSKEENMHGYRLGWTDGDNVYINNHLKFLMTFSYMYRNKYRIVSYQVEPMSVNHNDLKLEGDACNFSVGGLPQEVNSFTSNKLYFTYSVEWKESSPMDIYEQMDWRSIIKSFLAALLLSGIFTVYMVFSLCRDIRRYNSTDLFNDTVPVPGWIVVRGDVFRPPNAARGTTTTIALGIQTFFIVLFLTSVSMLGIIYPLFDREVITTAVIMQFTLSTISAYVSTRFLKTVKGSELKPDTAYSLSPIAIYPMVTTPFLYHYIENSSTSTTGSNISDFPSFMLLILACSVFGLLGYFVAFCKPPYLHPVPANEIPRQVPTQSWYKNYKLWSSVAGIIPFGAMFVYIEFASQNIAPDQLHYLYHILLIPFCILVVICSQTSIAMTYFQLHREDYRWWRHSFISSGVSAVSLCFYIIVFMLRKLSFSSYIGAIFNTICLGIMIAIFWLLISTIGILASYFFIRIIYGALKK